MNEYKEGDEVIITEGGAEGVVGRIHGRSEFPLHWEIRLTWPGDDYSDIFIYRSDEFKAVEK